LFSFSIESLNAFVRNFGIFGLTNSCNEEFPQFSTLLGSVEHFEQVLQLGAMQSTDPVPSCSLRFIFFVDVGFAGSDLVELVTSQVR